MDLTRLRLGELVAGGAALALLACLFFDWNRDLGADAGAASVGRFGAESGWSSLGIVTLVLVLMAIATALALVFLTITRRPVALPIGAAVLTTAVGVLVTLALALRVVLLDDSLGGAYLGLALMALIPVGGWITMADERTDAPYSAAPDLPPRPAPPAGA
jgi:hypothetical protein